MADFVSQYTGDQIEQILSSVEGKVAKIDIATTNTDDPEVPAAASLVYALDQALANLANGLTDYVKIAGAQTITGAKTFSASISAREGIAVPANKFITLVTDPTDLTHAVNLGFLKTHGVDANSAGLGLKSIATADGFVGFDFDPTELTLLAADAAWSVVVRGVVDNLPHLLASATLIDAVYADSRWVDLTVDYSSQKTDYATFKTNYTTDQTALNAAINARVLQTTYTTKMSALDSADAARLLISTYTTDQTALNAAINARVLQTTYDTRQTAIDTSLAAKMDYLPNGSVTAAASGSATVAIVAKGDVAYFLVTGIFTGTAKPAAYRVSVVCDGTTSYTFQETLFAGPSALTFNSSVSGSNILLTVTNGSSTVSCTLRSKTLVRY